MKKLTRGKQGDYSGIETLLLTNATQNDDQCQAKEQEEQTTSAQYPQPSLLHL
jgi:hypothetical protein